MPVETGRMAKGRAGLDIRFSSNILWFLAHWNRFLRPLGLKYHNWLNYDGMKVFSSSCISVKLSWLRYQNPFCSRFHSWRLLDVNSALVSFEVIVMTHETVINLCIVAMFYINGSFTLQPDFMVRKIDSAFNIVSCLRFSKKVRNICTFYYGIISIKHLCWIIRDFRSYASF